MSEGAEAGKIVTHQEITTESEDGDSDSSTDFDAEEIEKETRIAERRFLTGLPRGYFF